MSSIPNVVTSDHGFPRAKYILVSAVNIPISKSEECLAAKGYNTMINLGRWGYIYIKLCIFVRIYIERYYPEMSCHSVSEKQWLKQ